jgi:NAD(P)H-hydrate repair Nnr-like enzyme with NAD(P)H-hydrate dehydratase domain
VAAAKASADADAERRGVTEPELEPDATDFVAAVGVVIPQHDFVEDIRSTSAEVLQNQRAEEQIASNRLETAAVSVVAVGVFGFGFAALRDFLLRDRETSAAKQALVSDADADAAGVTKTETSDAKDDAVSPASGRARRMSKNESTPRAKTPTKKNNSGKKLALSPSGAREKTPLLPK